MAATSAFSHVMFYFVCLLVLLRLTGNFDVHDANQYFPYFLTILGLCCLISPFGPKTSRLLSYISRYVKKIALKLVLEPILIFYTFKDSLASL